MTTNSTPSVAPWVATVPPAAAGDNNHMATGPAADLLALLDDLAARGRALRLAEAEGAAARPETAAEAAGGGE